MFKAIGFSSISKGMVGLAAAAALAVGGLGIAGHAEARINGEPVSDFAIGCKALQDSYDAAVQRYHNAATPEELLAARHDLNVFTDAWMKQGCQAAYGNIQFIVASGTTGFSNLTTSGTLTSTSGGSIVAGASVLGTASRVR